MVFLGGGILIAVARSGRGRSYIFGGDTVITFGFGIGGEGIGMVTCQCGIANDLLWLGSPLHKVVGDGGGSLGFTIGIGFAEDSGCTSMKMSPFGGGEAIVEVTDQQWLPEMIADTRTPALFC